MICRLRNLLTIGEVATLLNLTTSQIRFYEKKGLLKPHLIDDNGYRLYSYEELDTLEIISAFRKLNLSINDIKEILHQKNTYSFVETLDKIEKQVNEEMMLLKKTMSSITMLRKNYTKFESDVPEVIHFPKRTLSIIDDSTHINRSEKELYEFVQKHGLHYYNNSYVFVTILNQPINIYCLYDHISDKKLPDFPTYELKEGLYFCINFVINDYNELDEIQEIGLKRCKDAGYEPIGESVFLEDFTTFLFSKTKIHLTLQVRIKSTDREHVR